MVNSKISVGGKLFLILSMVLVGIFSNQGYADVVEQDNTMMWEEWYDSIGNYLNKMSEIMNEGKQIAMRADRRLSEVMQKDDRTSVKAIIAETRNVLSAIIVELVELNPPQELKVYHEKAIEVYKYREMANDAILRDNLDDYYMYTNTAINSEIESIEELIQAYNNHGAPIELIDALYTIIQALKEQFK